MDALRYIAALENNTGAEVKDCIVRGAELIYIVKKGHMGMAIGKTGNNVKELGKILGKNVKVVEFSHDAVEFTANFLSTLKLEKVELNNGKLVIKADYKTRGAILGKEGKKVQILKDLLKRHHNIGQVMVE